MWSNKSSSSCILHVKDLQQTRRMLDNLLVSWMFQWVFHASIGPLQFLMCTKLSATMDIAFLIHLVLFFHFGIDDRRWSSLESSTIPLHPQKLTHLQFEIPNIENFPIEFPGRSLHCQVENHVRRKKIFFFLKSINKMGQTFIKKNLCVHIHSIYYIVKIYNQI